MPNYVPLFEPELVGFAPSTPYGDVGSVHLFIDPQNLQNTRIDLGKPMINPTLVNRQRVRMLVLSTETLPSRTNVSEPNFGVADQT